MDGNGKSVDQTVNADNDKRKANEPKKEAYSRIASTERYKKLQKKLKILGNVGWGAHLTVILGLVLALALSLTSLIVRLLLPTLQSFVVPVALSLTIDILDILVFTAIFIAGAVLTACDFMAYKYGKKKAKIEIKDEKIREETLKRNKVMAIFELSSDAADIIGTTVIFFVQVFELIMLSLFISGVISASYNAYLFGGLTITSAAIFIGYICFEVQKIIGNIGGVLKYEGDQSKTRVFRLVKALIACTKLFTATASLCFAVVSLLGALDVISLSPTSTIVFGVVSTALLLVGTLIELVNFLASKIAPAPSNKGLEDKAVAGLLSAISSSDDPEIATKVMTRVNDEFAYQKAQGLFEGKEYKELKFVGEAKTADEVVNGNPDFKSSDGKAVRFYGEDEKMEQEIMSNAASA